MSQASFNLGGEANEPLRIDGLAEIVAQNRFAQAERASLLASGAMPVLAYQAGGLARRIVDMPADDAASKGWLVQDEESEDGEPDKWMEDELSRLNAEGVFTYAARLARRDGSSAVLVLTDDSPLLTLPLDERSIGSITGLRVFAKGAIRKTEWVYTDATKLNYGQPQIYKLRLRGVTADMEVHESRLLRFSASVASGDDDSVWSGGYQAIPVAAGTGDVLPWDSPSVLDMDTLAAIEGYKDSVRLETRILERHQQIIVRMAGLARTLALPEGESIVQRRINLLDLQRGVMNSIAVDGEDEVSLASDSMGGVSDAVRDQKTNVAMASGIPNAVLFGDSASGLNSTGRTEMETYYNLCGKVRKNTLQPAAERLCTLIYRQRNAQSREPARWHVEFPPLWLPSAKEAADTAAVEATRAKTVADMLTAVSALNILDPDELRNAAAKMLPQLDIEPGSAVPEDAEPEPLNLLPAGTGRGAVQGGDTVQGATG